MFFVYSKTSLIHLKRSHQLELRNGNCKELFVVHILHGVGAVHLAHIAAQVGS